MTTAEHLLEELRTLPPMEMREVWTRLTQMVNNAGFASPPAGASAAFDRANAAAALDALDGKFADSGMLKLLLADRAHDRLHERAQLETYLADQRGSGHASS